MADFYQTNCTTVAEALASEDWRDRLIGEYNFINQKEKRLYNMLMQNELGLLKFKLNCSPDLLKAQLNSMSSYAYILSVRMDIEQINKNLKQSDTEPEVKKDDDAFSAVMESMEKLVTSLQEELEKEETENKEEDKVTFVCPNPHCDVAMEVSKDNNLNYCPSCGTKFEKGTKDATC